MILHWRFDTCRICSTYSLTGLHSSFWLRLSKFDRSRQTTRNTYFRYCRYPRSAGDVESFSSTDALNTLWCSRWAGVSFQLPVLVTSMWVLTKMKKVPERSLRFRNSHTKNLFGGRALLIFLSHLRWTFLQMLFSLLSLLTIKSAAM